MSLSVSCADFDHGASPLDVTAPMVISGSEMSTTALR